MSNKFKISWPKIAAEGMAIVVSILLAFWIQAWWENRQVRSEEVVALNQLKVEFETNARLLREKRQTQQFIYDAARHLLELTADKSGSVLDIPRVSDSIMAITEIRTFDAEVGALFSLINSLVSDLSEDEMGTWNYTDSSILPYVDSRASVRSLMDLSPVYSEWLDPGRGSDSVDIDVLIRDQEFENLVVERLKFQSIIIGGYDDLENQVAEILQLIDDELSKH
jgi:hypothetical protein